MIVLSQPFAKWPISRYETAMTTARDNLSPLFFSDCLDETLWHALVQKAEIARKKALSASICFALAISTKLSQLSMFDVAIIGPYVAALVIAGLCWECSNQLWRIRALKLISPHIAGSFGQMRFQMGWEALDIELWLKDMFGSNGARSTAWQTAGVYREISYRLSEQSVHRPHIHKGARSDPPSYHYLIEISVPKAFDGRVEIAPAATIKSFINTITGDVFGAGKRVYTGDPQFDQVFSVHADNVANLANLLSRDIRQIFLEISDENRSPKLRAWFESGWFHLEFPIAQRAFSLLSLLEPMTGLRGGMQQLCWELTFAQRLIDRFMGDYGGPLG